MRELRDLVQKIGGRRDCTVLAPAGQPVLRPGDQLPSDLGEFYGLCGGVRLFEHGTYPFQIVAPGDFVRSNPAIVGTDCADDISDTWYIVARDGAEAISVDCSAARSGRCYDSFWDRHGMAGNCAIVALSFTELLTRLLDGEGSYPYWLVDGGTGYGDAYADVDA